MEKYLNYLLIDLVDRLDQENLWGRQLPNITKSIETEYENFSLQLYLDCYIYHLPPLTIHWF